MSTGTSPSRVLDLVGVGVGPSNLSLAALSAAVADLDAVFLEARSTFRWHPGLLDVRARIQTSYLKDLVTPVDPTSPYSFLSFLRHTRRLYRFVVANPSHVSRVEFDQYYRWVAEQLPNVQFNTTVDSIDLENDRFAVHGRGRTTYTRSVVLATGLSPNLPECARPLLGGDILHASDYDLLVPEVAGRRVAVVGGGQTGAELFLRLIQSGRSGPREVTWLSSRPNFLPLDDTPFTNELFFPNYVTHFRGLPAAERRATLERQRFASDGIDAATLTQIYQRLYEVDFLDDPWLRYRLLPGHRLVDLAKRPDGVELVAERAGGARETLCADVVVLCTGFAYTRPACLAPLADRIHRTADGYRVRADFSIEWDGPPGCRIYVQNAARHSHGIADPNLSLAAWRSAIIVNSVCGRQVYDVDGCSATIEWPQDIIEETFRDR